MSQLAAGSRPGEIESAPINIRPVSGGRLRPAAGEINPDVENSGAGSVNSAVVSTAVAVRPTERHGQNPHEPLTSGGSDADALSLEGDANHTPAVSDGDRKVHWTPSAIAASVLLFCIAGVTEIGGGWLVWQSIREERPWWWALCGAVVLVAYGFVPTLQPTDNFGRIFAVYGA